ncbi:MAG: DUF1735 domain-containing protein [Dysgonamonadaceae bacterium]|jgi:hypothetical protein|nr:DUF1735 domain-containing protein [Dysgonamonadaceae bacterium]
MKNLIAIKYACALTLLGSIMALSGCDKNINDFQDITSVEASNDVYVDAKEQTICYTLVHTVNEGVRIYDAETKELDTLWIKFPVHSAQPVISETKVKFLRDDALLDVYRIKNGINYVQFPNEFTTNTSLTIPKGETISEDSVSFAYTGKLTAFNGITGNTGQQTYLLPLRMLTVSGSGAKIDYDERVCYVVITVIQKIGVKFSGSETYMDGMTLNTWDWKMPFTLTKQAIDNDVNVSLEVNNSLINGYNSAYNTNYPSVSATFPTVNLTMGKTETSVAGTLEPSSIPSATGGIYLIPLEIKSVSGVDGAAADNTAKVHYFIARVSNQLTDAGRTVSVYKTGSAVDASAAAALGVKQEDRSGYAVDVREAATYLTKAPYSASYPASNMVTDGTGTTYFTSTANDFALNVVIDLGKDVDNISGIELDGYSSTANRFAKSYEVGYATEAQFAQYEESYIGTIDNCARYVYAQITPSIPSARYIILRNVKPALTSGTRYIGWLQFYVYTE